jgi:hypothetical protein
MFQLSAQKRQLTNVNCIMKVDVRSDRCEPEMEVLFSKFRFCLYDESGRVITLQQSQLSILAFSANVWCRHLVQPTLDHTSHIIPFYCTCFRPVC